MRMAIMGAGALGGFFGARLAAAGQDVWLIARGAHLKAMQDNGLRVESAEGAVHVPRVQATDDPAKVGPVDLVLFFVKNYDLEAAVRQAAPMISPRTVVASFQNGVSAPGIVARHVSPSRVMPGVARIPAEIVAPGVVRHTGAGDVLVFGGAGPEIQTAALELHRVLTTAGTHPRIARDMDLELWEKFVLQSATSALTALTRLTFGQIAEVPETTRLMLRAMEETAQVARTLHPHFPRDMAARQYQAFLGLGGGVRSSMATDLVQGRKLELEWISGEVVRLGRQHGIATPVHEVALAALWPFRNGAPKPA